MRQRGVFLLPLKDWPGKSRLRAEKSRAFPALLKEDQTPAAAPPCGFFRVKKKDFPAKKRIKYIES
jgi:hypothetical protein